MAGDVDPTYASLRSCLQELIWFYFQVVVDRGQGTWLICENAWSSCFSFQSERYAVFIYSQSCPDIFKRPESTILFTHSFNKPPIFTATPATMKFLAVLASVLALTIASPLPEAAPEPDASSLNVILLAIINAFPAISGAVSDVANLIAASQKTLAAITGVSTTQNGLSGSCKAMTVIFARGT
jgi:hypothetical protein